MKMKVLLLSLDGLDICISHTGLELIVARPRALAGVMNFACVWGKVTLLVRRVFHVEAFTVSPLCHHLNYLTTSLIHTSAGPGLERTASLQTSHLLEK